MSSTLPSNYDSLIDSFLSDVKKSGRFREQYRREIAQFLDDLELLSDISVKDEIQNLILRDIIQTAQPGLLLLVVNSERASFAHLRTVLEQVLGFAYFGLHPSSGRMWKYRSDSIPTGQAKDGDKNVFSRDFVGLSKLALEHPNLKEALMELAGRLEESVNGDYRFTSDFIHVNIRAVEGEHLKDEPVAKWFGIWKRICSFLAYSLLLENFEQYMGDRREKPFQTFVNENLSDKHLLDLLRGTEFDD